MSIRGLTIVANRLSIKGTVAKKTIEELLKERLRELGSKGGKMSAKRLSKDARIAKAKTAAAARWKKKEK